MALPFSIYLANIPFLNKNYLITNGKEVKDTGIYNSCLLYTSPSPRD